MNVDENLTKDSDITEIQSPESDYRTPLQTPNSVTATPVPRRFVDFTDFSLRSSSDDSTFSITTIDPTFEEESLEPGSLDDNSFATTHIRHQRNSNTESTHILNPALKNISTSADMSSDESYLTEAEKSEDELKEAQLLDISGDQTVDMAENVQKFQAIVRQGVDIVNTTSDTHLAIGHLGETVLHNKDDCESRSFSDVTLKNVNTPVTYGKSSVLMQVFPSSKTSEGISELQSHIEQTENNMFEAPKEVTYKFLNEPFIKNTIPGDSSSRFKPDLISSSYKGDLNYIGKLTGECPNVNLDTEVNREMLSEPNHDCFKPDVLTFDEITKVFDGFLKFPKVKESDEKKRSELHSMKTNKNDTEMIFGCSSKQSFSDTLFGWPSHSFVFKKPDQVPKYSLSHKCSRHSEETASFEGSTQLSSNGTETQRELENTPLDSSSRDSISASGEELAKNLDKDLILFETDVSSELKASGDCGMELGLQHNQSFEVSLNKVTFPQNLSGGDHFGLSFTADVLKKEQKLREDHESKLLSDIQELKSKRFENTQGKSVLPAMKSPFTLPTVAHFPKSEFEEYVTILKPEEAQMMDFEMSVSPPNIPSGEKLQDVSNKFENLKTENDVVHHDVTLNTQKKFSLEVQESEAIGSSSPVHMANKPDVSEVKETPTYLFSKPRFFSVENSEKAADDPEKDDSIPKHTCQKYFNLTPCKVAVPRLKKRSGENVRAAISETGTSPMDVIPEEERDDEATNIQFDKSIAKAVMKALTDINSKNGVISAQILKSIVQQKLVQVDSKLEKEVQRFLKTAEELGIVTTKGLRYYPQIKASSTKTSVTKQKTAKNQTHVQKPSSSKSKKVAVKVSTPSSRRLETYRKKAMMNSPVPLLSLRSRCKSVKSPRVSSKVVAKDTGNKVVKNLRSRVIMVESSSGKND